MTEQLKHSEKLATQRFRGKKLSKQGKKQDKGFSPHSSQDKKQTKRASLPGEARVRAWLCQGLGEVVEWGGGGGMRWAQREGVGWSFASDDEEFGIYSKCRGKPGQG